MRRLSESEKFEIWDLFEPGESLRSIGRRLGRPPSTIRTHVVSLRFRRPLLAGEWSPQRLSLSEREEISQGLAADEPLRGIAQRLGRAASTGSREVAGNGGRRKYRAAVAHRARRPKPAKLASNHRHQAVVEEKLELWWSPRQILRWLVETCPSDKEMRVSQETIYQSLFIPAKGRCGKELWRCLRTGRATRRPQGRPKSTKGQIRDMVMISERPAEVEDRAVPGHSEGDLLIGKTPDRDRDVGGTLVPVGHALCAPQRELRRGRASGALCDRAALPEHLCKSLTWDQGKEIAQHVQFSVDTGVEVFFCDPNSPRQRGTNENTNGLHVSTSQKHRHFQAPNKTSTSRVLAEHPSSTNHRLDDTIGQLAETLQ